MRIFDEFYTFGKHFCWKDEQISTQVTLLIYARIKWYCKLRTFKGLKSPKYQL